ncbi:hypothetical protein AKJ53_01485 [candidate division MSBL1 archaeon SCGC-AAA382F02]|uniref:Uncharacterized protein n=1 Tax=candidate division MSBL1 archaeon SCGC-AAA382F02 TaxID=1698282 RepID=A0A133VHY2_9EURY|nr:hypothetical protein AKJ53_01485 [candidate division MSBL1 archaeon SCGC-AAA382F02]
MIATILFLFQIFLILWISAVLINLLYRYELGSNDCNHFSKRQKRFFDKLPFTEAEFWQGKYKKGSFERKLGIETHIYLRLKVWFLSIPYEPLAFAPLIPVLDSDIISHKKIRDPR